MKHLYIEGESNWTLILLHGTGGRETDLLEFSTMVDRKANILAFRGNVIQDDQTRFFTRHAHNVFDDDSLKHEGQLLHDALIKCTEEYGIDLKKSIFIGYSNGANMAAYLTLNIESDIAGGVFLHPAYHTSLISEVSLLGKSYLITAGARDMVALAGDAYQLKKHLELRGGSTEVKLNDGPHAIMSEELMEAHVWFLNLKKSLEDE